MRKKTMVVLTLAAAIAWLAACSKQEPAPDPVRAVRVMTVNASGAGGRQEFAAEVRARVESRLGFRVGGKMIKRNVDLGASVKAGQVLAQLDPQDLKLGQDAAKAAVVSAQVGLDQAQSDYKRYKDLRDQGFISTAELERRDSSLKAAKAQYEQALAQSNVQGNQTAYAALIADANGVITGVEADAGTVVAAGTPVLRLAHDGPRDVVFAVPEDRLAALKAAASQPGALTVRIWGAPEGSVLPATLREVAAATDPVTRTFQAKADIGNAPVKLGQTAVVVLTFASMPGAIKLPLTALLQHDGKSSVWVLDPAALTVKSQPVQVAGFEGNEVILAGGLTSGQQVVTAGVHVLNEGQKVKLYVEPVSTDATAASGATR